ncbi:MAG: winged helix-turn-helix domain-containing protein [Oscillospiraceae bacterium]
MIFCVEDDSGIREIEVYTLRSTGFEATGFPDGTSFFEALKSTVPELVILDVMLPGEDGIEILKKLKENRETRDIPIIMATARGSEYDKITGLDTGADDYLVKPFGMMEMVSRVRAVLRRTGSGKKCSTLEFGPITLNEDEHMVTVSDRPVTLTLKEYEILRLLMSSPGTVFTRDRLLSEIWDVNYDGETRTVDVHIRTLRSKLGEAGSMISTVRGVGYRLEAQRR